MKKIILFLVFVLLASSMFVLAENATTSTNATETNITTPICVNQCGDGVCAETVCLAVGCPCAETSSNCPSDCGTTTTTCKDSDGGVMKFEKGKVINNNEVFEDYCLVAGGTFKYVREYSCDENGEVVATTLECSNRCEDGACLCQANVCDDGIVPDCKIINNECTCEACESPVDMDFCLDGLNNYWDQETDACYSGYVDDVSFFRKMCSDPDGGKKIYEQAHTFGFRSYSSADDPSRDLRIRTGGADSCNNGQMHEHYCDGKGYIQTAYVNCPNGCKKGACIKGEPITETITCKFENSKTEQQCYLAGQWGPSDEGTKFCYADADSGSCFINYKSYKGEEVTWKSTCGGYQYTKQDGEDEVIYFDCKSGETNISTIKKQGFKNIYFECYDGATSRSTGREACKTAGFWKKFATNFCKSHCKKKGDVEKCGVNTFSISEECYIDGELPEVEEETPVEIEEEEGRIELICKNSCPLNGKCYVFGYRKKGQYCSDEGGFVNQMKNRETCENNFECSSNVCIDGECISGGLLKRIMNWFRKIFGRE